MTCKASAVSTVGIALFPAPLPPAIFQNKMAGGSGAGHEASVGNAGLVNQTLVHLHIGHFT